MKARKPLNGRRMSSWIRHHELASPFGVEDAFKSGNNWEVRISYVGGSKTVRFSYLWQPDTQFKTAENDDAKALGKLCQTDGWLSAG